MVFYFYSFCSHRLYYRVLCLRVYAVLWPNRYIENPSTLSFNMAIKIHINVNNIDALRCVWSLYMNPTLWFTNIFTILDNKDHPITTQLTNVKSFFEYHEYMLYTSAIRFTKFETMNHVLTLTGKDVWQFRVWLPLESFILIKENYYCICIYKYY